MIVLAVVLGFVSVAQIVGTIILVNRLLDEQRRVLAAAVAPSQAAATAVLTAPGGSAAPGRGTRSAPTPDPDPRPPTSADIPLGLSGF